VPSPWVALAARTDLNLVRAAISSQGRYYDRHRTIVMRDDLLIEEERRHLWHELVHADRQDRVGHMDAKVERLVDRRAAENAMPWESIRWAWDQATDLTEMAGLLKLPEDWVWQPRALGLVRVSKERDGMISPEVQRVAISDYAAARGYEITGWLEGIDESGSRARSAWWPRLDQAVAAVEAGEYDVILVWKYSRVARHRLRWASRSTASRTPAAGSSPPPSSSTPPPAAGPVRPRDARRAPGLRGRADRGGLEGRPRNASGPGSRPTGSRSGATLRPRAEAARARPGDRAGARRPLPPLRRRRVGLRPRPVAQRPRLAHATTAAPGRTGRCAGSWTPGSPPAGSWSAASCTTASTSR
jgi:hypothetical protein